MANKFADFGIDTASTAFIGKRIEMDSVFNEAIKVHKYRIVPSRYPKDRGHNKCLHIQISIGEVFHVVFTVSTALMDQIQQVPINGFPFDTKITKENKRFQFN